ncbi:MAG TPA: hypothetical protein VFM16_08465 [Holophagaceae bacterium]|nr:hypothetical protein [Holophagaceae bacterium]
MEVLKSALVLAGAFGMAAFLNPSLLLGRIPAMKELEVPRQVGLIRRMAMVTAILGMAGALAIFYGAR